MRRLQQRCHSCTDLFLQLQLPNLFCSNFEAEQLLMLSNCQLECRRQDQTSAAVASSAICLRGLTLATEACKLATIAPQVWDLKICSLPIGEQAKPFVGCSST